jgi:hypothetical protein
MNMDEAVKDAKSACAEFQASQYASTDAEAEALKKVLDSVKMLLSSTSLAMGRIGKDGIALEVYSAHRESAHVCQVIKVSISTKGELMKEDIIACCPKLCAVLAKQVYKVEVGPMLKSGVSAKVVVENISIFLEDHIRSMLSLASSTMN